MLRGRFRDTTGRPYIEGRLLIPQLRVDAELSLLIDTGADTSLIGYADATEMRVDYSRLGRRVEGLGVGGKAFTYPVRASLVFTDPGRFHYVYVLNALDIAAPGREAAAVPSLLGRDVLDRWRMLYDPSRAKLSFIVRTADRTVAIR